MWTIMVTAATLVAAVGSVELDKYRGTTDPQYSCVPTVRSFPRAAPRGV